MELKFSGKPTIKTCLLWGIFAYCVNMGLVVLLITPLNDLMIFSIMVGFDILFLITIKYQCNANRKYTFLIVDDSGITIKKGRGSKGNTILFDNIETIAEQRNTVRIQEFNGVETKIPLYLLDLTGHKELRNAIEDKCEGKILK